MTTEIYLVRHAPSVPAGYLYGRTDVAADTGNAEAMDRLARSIGVVDRIVTSPARRCRQTTHALWPESREVVVDARLWEQDFGDWDGRAFEDIPDLGMLSVQDLAAQRPPGGESFDDVVRRVQPAVRELAGSGATNVQRIAVVAHAGVIRAALGMALVEAASALSFDVATLSLTQMRLLPGGSVSVLRTNWRP